jgi:meiotically up-regulated gene 157 (Mug157) protein
MYRAQWLRDTANQLAHYHSLLGHDQELATLVKAVINNEASIHHFSMPEMCL